MSLETFWFIVVAFFWTGFFVLEGFDFGVGVLHTVVGRDERERRTALNAIGPFWDGNEVWLIVAGAAMFAAFPAWYATLFSGLYLALLLILVALIARGVAFEFREKVTSPRWQRTWTWATTLGSGALPLLFGIGLGGMVAGLPIDADGEYTGGFARHLHRLRRLDRADAAVAVGPARRDVPGAQDRGRGARALARRRRARLAGGARRRRPSSPCGRRSVLSVLAAVAVLGRGRAAARRPRGLGVHRHRGRDGRDASARCSSTCSRTC